MSNLEKDKEILKDIFSINLLTDKDSVEVRNVKICKHLNRILIYLSCPEFKLVQTHDLPILTIKVSKQNDYYSIEDDFFDTETEKAFLFDSCFPDDTLERINKLENFFTGIKSIVASYQDNKYTVDNIIKKYS